MLLENEDDEILWKIGVERVSDFYLSFVVMK